MYIFQAISTRYVRLLVMDKRPLLHKPLTRCVRGFSLIEAAIFLGVMGLVLGAVWGAASTVNFNRQINATIGDMIQITQNMRSLYSRQSGFSGTSGFTTGDNITEAMVNSEVVPAEMIDPTDLTTLRSAWQTPVMILVGPTLDTFRISFADTLPTQVCVAITARAIGASRDKGLTELMIGGTSYTGNALNNLSTTTIPSNCTNVTLVLKLKG